MSKDPQPPTEEISVRCAFDEMVRIPEIKPNPRNPNTHPPAQIELLAKLIRHQGWRLPIVISNLSGLVVAGHGRYEAALILGVEAAPVNFQDFDSKEDEHAHLMADNRIAEMAELDFQGIGELLRELEASGTDLDLTGFRDFERDPLLAADWEPADVGELDDGGGDGGAKSIGLSAEQRLIFEKAMEKMKTETDDTEMSEGRGVELLAAEYLAG